MKMLRTRYPGKGLLKSSVIRFGLLMMTVAITTQLEARHRWRWSPCEQVAYKAYTSDLIEAAADYTLARAKATNIGDYSERREAYMEAYHEYREAREEAREQLDARVVLCEELGEDRYWPEIDPENFCTPEETAANPNPYFMLIPGRVMVYGGEFEEDEGEIVEEIVEVTVTDNTVEIMDVVCMEVRDIVTIDDEIVEDTRDWYAQDKDGNVWYFGEIALNYEDGQISDIDGSWKAGEDGALPGVLVFAEPVVSRTHRQEFLLGEAEDVAQVEAVGVTVISNEMEYTDCVQTLEYTPLEADSFEYKYAQAGVGVILEESIESGETLELLAINPE